MEMSFFIVKGSGPLKGEVDISGAKNAVLPILCACLLTDEECVIKSVPPLMDVCMLLDILKSIGAEVSYENEVVKIRFLNITKNEIDTNLAASMRASFLIMGPMLARTGKAKIPLPGGCRIGTRPVDLHLKGFEILGAKINQEFGYVSAEAEQLKGDYVYLDFPSVGATENIMMAASISEGATLIENAAEEPEIHDLAVFLNKMGANIKMKGSGKIKITGVKKLKGTEHTVMPDRIETGTFMAAAAVTGGDIVIKNAVLDNVQPASAKLAENGTITEKIRNGIHVYSTGEKKAFNIKTMPFPGFPTDMQAIFMSLMTISKGTSMVTETVFENRFLQAAELKRMGADIKTEGRTAVIEGVEKLTGARVNAPDLRAGAALVIAALASEGMTEIGEIQHIERGYSNFDEKLRKLGADIEKSDEEI
ncbi:MAG: UDP-N-acetylglucosamine 1-carboxyvinyltransferase [Clostridia bacterium]|jgi:UDP-N-acetylglucosamine 1-carboxyvinyltransferase|nr:UDP-N-acetylglucosamine 1-carboxyvinyltransferase [Clostridia bacterium]